MDNVIFFVEIKFIIEGYVNVYWEVKVKRLAYTVGVIMTLVSFSSHAYYSGERNISYLKAQVNGLYFKLKGFDKSDAAFEIDADDPLMGCSNGFWILKEEDSNYEARFSLLLAAYMSAKTIEVSFYECAGSHTRASSVKVET